MAESIDMPIGGQTRVVPRNHVLDGVQIPHGEKGNFGVGHPKKALSSDSPRGRRNFWKLYSIVHSCAVVYAAKNQ